MKQNYQNKTNKPDRTRGRGDGETPRIKHQAVETHHFPHPIATPPPWRTLALHLSGGLLPNFSPPPSTPLCLILSLATLRLLSYPSPTEQTSWLLLLLLLLPRIKHQAMVTD